MTTIVSGMYKNGKVDLLETPSGLHEGRVRVVLISEDNVPLSTCLLTYGKYSSGQMSKLDDFHDAEWQGDPKHEEHHAQ